jgi:Fe-S-cluster containining protein
MICRETIFLTRQQALEAVCMDFRRYEPQIMLFSEVLRVISENNAVIMQDVEREGRWVAAEPGSKMVWLEGRALGEWVCRALHENDPNEAVMVSICKRVFQTHAYPGTDPQSNQKGIFIETGMEAFSCRQCGDCCKFLDYHDALTAADVKRWKQLGRQDVLARVGVSRKADGTPTYRIWVEPEGTKLSAQCPFLKHLHAENRWICGIHDIKPRICREYPVSRKHGLMTGCPGFST